MLIFGRLIFYIGILGLAFQMMETWLEVTGLPITSDNLYNAMLWWTCFGVLAVCGLVLKRKFGGPDED